MPVDKKTQIRNEKIQKALQDHYDEAKEHFSTNNIVGIFLQGSQNYGLDDDESDVDTKLVVTPSLSDLVRAKDPVSTTYVRANDEHIDFKDVRLMLNTFKKQNLNFVEILFTPWFILNPLYESIWGELVKYSETIAHYNNYLAVKAMKGVALEKYHALEHRYPSRIPIIDKFGYDPKQLSHLIRVRNFIEKFIGHRFYEDCMHPDNPEYIIAVKRGYIPHEKMREVADHEMALIDELTKAYTKDSEYNRSSKGAEDLLDSVQERIMITSIKNELELERKSQECKNC